MGKTTLPYLQKECPQSQLPDIPSQSAAAAFVTATALGARSHAPSEISRAPSILDRTNGNDSSLMRRMTPLEPGHGASFVEDSLALGREDPPGGAPHSHASSPARAGKGPSTSSPSPGGALGGLGPHLLNASIQSGRPVARSVSDTRRPLPGMHIGGPDSDSDGGDGGHGGHGGDGNGGVALHPPL